MTLSVIIVSYNTKNLLRECLRSLFERDRKKMVFEVFVVDNASADDSAEMVKKEFPQVVLMQNKKNMGFSKANNKAVRKTKGTFILFLNPDTIADLRVLEEMVAFMEDHGDAGVATCRVNLVNGQLDDACHRGFPTPWNALCYFSGLSRLFPRAQFFNGYNMGWKDMTAAHEIDACAGAFMMVKKEAGASVGWWDEDYFWYGEDIDFCYRLKQKGWKIFFYPTVSIIHYKGVSGGIKEVSLHMTTADRQTKMRATKARFDAMKIFYKKHYAHTYPKVITWLVMQGIAFKMKLALNTL